MAHDRMASDSDGKRQLCAHPTPSGGDVSIRVPAPREVVRLFGAVLSSVRLAIERETGHLPSEADAFELMMDHALATWGVDDVWLRQRMRRMHPIFERDGWLCSVPGCTRRNLHAHHIVFRSCGGSDDPGNLTTLCAFHHQRGVHGGTVRITGKAPDALLFELGLREGKAPLARYRSGNVVV